MTEKGRQLFQAK